MRFVLLGLVMLTIAPASPTQGNQAISPGASRADLEQQVISLSKEKWLWMADRKLDSLEPLFHEESVFVHMSGSMTKSQELDVIRTGRIHYKQADIQNVSARIVGSTAIVLSRIRLLAVVGGNEVTNPFMVTEVYIQQGGAWKLIQLSFSRLRDQ